MAEIPIVCAASKDAPYAGYNFCSGGQVNQLPAAARSAERLIEAYGKAKRDCDALLPQMVTADETDTEAMAHGSTTRPGSTSRRSPTATRRRRNHSRKASFSQPLRRKKLGVRKLPTNQDVFVGSCASVPQMLG